MPRPSMRATPAQLYRIALEMARACREHGWPDREAVWIERAVRLAQTENVGVS